MEILSASQAKATFSQLARGVIKKRKPVVIRFPGGFVQLAPWDIPEEVPPAPAGSLKPLPREIELSNTFGETFGCSR